MLNSHTSWTFLVKQVNDPTNIIWQLLAHITEHFFKIALKLSKILHFFMFAIKVLLFILKHKSGAQIKSKTV